MGIGQPNHISECSASAATLLVSQLAVGIASAESYDNGIRLSVWLSSIGGRVVNNCCPAHVVRLASRSVGQSVCPIDQNLATKAAHVLMGSVTMPLGTVLGQHLCPNTHVAHWDTDG